MINKEQPFPLTKEDYDILILVINKNLKEIKEGKPVFKNDNPTNKQFMIDGFTRLSQRTLETFNKILVDSPVILKMYRKNIKEYKDEAKRLSETGTTKT